MGRRAGAALPLVTWGQQQRGVGGPWQGLGGLTPYARGDRSARFAALPLHSPSQALPLHSLSQAGSGSGAGKGGAGTESLTVRPVPPLAMPVRQASPPVVAPGPASPAPPHPPASPAPSAGVRGIVAPASVDFGSSEEEEGEEEEEAAAGSVGWLRRGHARTATAPPAETALALARAAVSSDSDGEGSDGGGNGGSSATLATLQSRATPASSARPLLPRLEAAAPLAPSQGWRGAHLSLRGPLAPPANGARFLQQQRGATSTAAVRGATGGGGSSAARLLPAWTSVAASSTGGQPRVAAPLSWLSGPPANDLPAAPTPPPEIRATGGPAEAWGTPQRPRRSLAVDPDHVSRDPPEVRAEEAAASPLPRSRSPAARGGGIRALVSTLPSERLPSPSLPFDSDFWDGGDDAAMAAPPALPSPQAALAGSPPQWPGRSPGSSLPPQFQRLFARSGAGTALSPPEAPAHAVPPGDFQPAAALPN